MQIKTTIRNHFTSLRTAIKDWHTITNECEKGNPSYIANEDLKWCSHLKKQFESFLKIKHVFTIVANGLKNSTLRYQSKKKKKIYIHAKTCTQMSLAALYIWDKNWKEPK